MRRISTKQSVRAFLLTAAGLPALSCGAQSWAQAAEAPPAEETEAAPEEIIVTGIRRSLESATEAKRESVSFGDSIFAEDIGKLPATNLAETLNRIPGVNLRRDLTGEGLQVSIRGLGPSFSKVLMNGTNIAIASDGGTAGGSSNREVDLDFFPSELFTRLDVSKSPMASQLEGGIAGVVNLRNARPFDREGFHVTAVAQGQYSNTNDKLSPRGALIVSKTFGDTFGVLLGVAAVKAKTRVDGFETVGWTDGAVDCATGCNTGLDTGNGFFYAPVVPNNTGFGLVPGTSVDLAATSGLPIERISAAKIPRLGRSNYSFGDRSRISALASIEWRPSDTLHFTLDGLYAKTDRDFNRVNAQWVVRASGPGTSPTSTGGMVPIDVTVDGNDIVTSGTFANSSFFVEYGAQKQTTDYYNIIPGLSWELSDSFSVQMRGNYSESKFFREQPQFDVQTSRESGLVVDYQNDGANLPIITPNQDLNDPNLGWTWYRLNVQNVRRKTETKGAQIDFSYKNDDFTVNFGAAYDDGFRTIRAYDNSTAYQEAVCGSPCDGTSGAILNAQLSQYLRAMPVSNFGHLFGTAPGVAAYIFPDVDAIKQATNYQFYSDNAPEVRGVVTGGSPGDIREKTWGAYGEINGNTEVASMPLKVNFGMRYFSTDQTVTSPVQLATGLQDVTLKSSYEGFLPSFNATLDVTDNLKLRVAASRSMTRPNPSQLVPGTTFSDPAAQLASAGNPGLEPYFSDNIDIGGEFYTGGAGYVGVVAFRKDIDGFTATVTDSLPFSALGINIDDLTAQQRAALEARGGQNAIILVSRPVNLNKLRIEGVEATWVQPLDFVVQGLGFTANGTYINQSSEDDLVAPGVAPYSFNLSGYYENHGVSVRLNYVWNDKTIAANAPQSGINVPLRSDARGQLDLSAGYTLPFANEAFRLTLDVLNITNAPLRTTFGYDNATYELYYPGTQVLAGIRASF